MENRTPGESEPGPMREFVFNAKLPVTVRVRAVSRAKAFETIAAHDHDIFVDYLSHDGTGDGQALWITYGNLAGLTAVAFREEDRDDETAARLARLPATELLPTYQDLLKVARGEADGKKAAVPEG